MRLTIRTNLALRTLMACAANPDTLLRKAEVAERINASENHLAQVINQLGQAGFLNTQRGRHGGFTLARAPETIRVGEVFRVIEPESDFVECFGDANTCPLKGPCRLGMHMRRAIAAFHAALDDVTLDDLVGCNAALTTILTMTREREAAVRCPEALATP